MIKRLLSLLGIGQRSTIRWEEVSNLYDSSKPFVSWVVVDGKLLLGENDWNPVHPISKFHLEESIIRLKDQIGARHIAIEVIYIEPHIATGLWYEGTLTLNHLRSADGRYRGTTFEMELAGEQYLVSIQPHTYYDSYEFIVEGLPGVQRVRDLPDSLAIVTGETVFPG